MASQFKEEPPLSPELKLEEEEITEDKVNIHADEDTDEPDLDSQYCFEDLVPGSFDEKPGGENYRNKKKGKKKFKEHVETNHIGIKYTCEHCGKQFQQKHNLARHVRTEHEGIPLLKLSCDQCNFTSAYKNYLNLHIKSVHEGIRTHLCDKCDYKAATKGVLIQHIETVHEGIRYQCDQCEYKARTKGGLKKHLVNLHSGIKLHCDQCNYQTADQRALDAHIRFVHEGIGFTCDYCGLKTATEWKLKRHIKTHEQRERTEKCPKCDKEFYTKETLRKHVISVHGIKPFYCEVCGTKSSRLSNLNAHRKSHSKPKITKLVLIDMVRNGEHPFYSREDLPMLESSVAD